MIFYAIALVEPKVAHEPVTSRTRLSMAEPQAAKEPRASREVRRRWQGHGLSSLDRESFLLRFAQLAGDELVPCLRAEFGVAGKISLLARLSSKGRLTAVRLIQPLRSAPSCVNATIRAMPFEELGARLVDDSVELEWQFAW